MTLRASIIGLISQLTNKKFSSSTSSQRHCSLSKGVFTFRLTETRSFGLSSVFDYILEICEIDRFVAFESFEFRVNRDCAPCEMALE